MNEVDVKESPAGIGRAFFMGLTLGRQSRLIAALGLDRGAGVAYIGGISI